MPRLTVIVPAYNHERFIGSAIKSVLEQSFGDFELLVNDDASPDKTAEVVHSIDDPRIKYTKFGENRGASTVVNEALRRAQGEYVAILNSDDYFLPEKLQTQVRFLDNHPHVGAVFGLPRFVDESGAALDPTKNPFRNLFIDTNMTREQWLRRFFCIGNALCHPTVMVRRKCYEEVGGYDTRLAQLPDFDVWIEICKRHEIHILNMPLTAFRVLTGEQNASGGSPVAKARHDWELQLVLRRYLDLDDKALQSIFREDFRDIDREGAVAPRVALGLLAIEIARKSWAPSSYRAFGLQVLHEELARGSQGIIDSEYMRLTGVCDVFNYSAVRDLRIAACNDSEYLKIINSRSWKLTEPLRAASSRFQHFRNASRQFFARVARI